jgi:hypothetical protein
LKARGCRLPHLDTDSHCPLQSYNTLWEPVCKGTTIPFPLLLPLSLYISDHILTIISNYHVDGQ